MFVDFCLIVDVTQSSEVFFDEIVDFSNGKRYFGVRVRKEPSGRYPREQWGFQMFCPYRANKWCEHFFHVERFFRPKVILCNSYMEEVTSALLHTSTLFWAQQGRASDEPARGAGAPGERLVPRCHAPPLNISNTSKCLQHSAAFCNICCIS